MSTKRKAPGRLAPPTVKPSAKNPYKSTIDEAHASVSRTDILPSSAPDTIEISSDAGSDEDMSDEEDVANPSLVNGHQKPQINGNNANQLPSPNIAPAGADGAESEDEDATSPSFGELLRGNETIDVPSLLQQSSNAHNAMASRARTTIAPPSHQSLTTVLSQALRTDDTDLLESCLHTTDLTTIRNTIENIDSTLAGNLLNKLAARLYRRPGRSGSLMTWIQWTMIAHGGALASQPKVVQGLGALQKVLAERAKGLNSLLALKGKLDMLEGQMDMRRKVQRTSGLIRQGSDDEDDEDVIWVEGEKDNGSEKALLNGRAGRGKRDAIDDDNSDNDDSAVNGVIGGSSDEDDESEDEEDEEDAAEESLDEDEVDHDDVDESMGEDEESDVEAAPPSKVQKVAKSFSKRK